MDLARKNERAILQALAEHSQTKVASLIGVSDSTVTRTDKMAMGAFIAACGLKLVPAHAQTFDASYIDALKVMAGVGLKSPSVVVSE